MDQKDQKILSILELIKIHKKITANLNGERIWMDIDEWRALEAFGNNHPLNSIKLWLTKK